METKIIPAASRADDLLKLVRDWDDMLDHPKLQPGPVVQWHCDAAIRIFANGAMEAGWQLHRFE